MASVQTYQGIVRGGHIQVEGAVDLPEGSHVVIIVAGEHPPIEEQAAGRKATRWLVEHVGNMLIADEGRLVDADGRLVWRFGAFVTGRGHQPRGPIGYVDVDTAHGNVLTDEQQAEKLIHDGTAFIRSLSSPER